MHRLALPSALLALALGACTSPPGGPSDGGSNGDGNNLDSSLGDGANGGDGAARDAAPYDAPFVCPGDVGTGVDGIVTTPNGQDPVPGAIVYVSRTAPAPFVAGVSCDACELPADAVAYAQTDINGHFSLPHAFDAGGAGFLVVQQGRFRRVTPLTFARCTPAMLTADQTRLPGNHTEGEVPRILVANRVLDDIGRVISRIGISEVDTVDGCRGSVTSAAAAASYDVTAASCPLGHILADEAQLAQYNILFVPCGSMGFDYSFQVLGAATNARIATNVAAWMERGGRLYVSDTAYGLLARSFPEAITFATGAEGDRDPANVGVGGSHAAPGTYPGHPQDDQLASWLRARGALAADNTVPLTGFISPWVAIDTLPPATKNWMSADVTWFSASGPRRTEPNKALTITADYLGASRHGCGRAVFTSYHVDSASVSATDPLTPQERVLEWLLLELGACITTPG